MCLFSPRCYFKLFQRGYRWVKRSAYKSFALLNATEEDGSFLNNLIVNLSVYNNSSEQRSIVLLDNSCDSVFLKGVIRYTVKGSVLVCCMNAEKEIYQFFEALDAPHAILFFSKSLYLQYSDFLNQYAADYPTVIL